MTLLPLLNCLYSVIIYVGFFSSLVESELTADNPAINFCPAGFDLVNGQCRGFAKDDINVPGETALDYVIGTCSDLNSVPPIVRNEEDNTYWGSLSGESHIILGIICDVPSKQWLWIDGTQIDYKPSHHGKELDEPCVSHGFFFFCGYCDRTEWNFFDTIKFAGTNINPLLIYCIEDLKKPAIREDSCILFDQDEPDSMCYEVYVDAEYWSDAQNKCKTLGGDLASIHSSQENGFIRRLAVSNGLVYGLMLGATVSGKSNNFSWLDGSSWDYSNFLPGFPIEGFGDCLMMATGDTNGCWENSACSTKVPYVCARKPYTDSPPNTCLGPNIKEGDIVRTPGFPMDASTYCDFFLKVDEGKLVEIEVLLVEANNCCDHFLLYEVSSGYTLIANLTGAIGGAKFRTTTSNLMRASWQPNGGVNVRGAMFTFRGV